MSQEPKVRQIPSVDGPLASAMAAIRVRSSMTDLVESFIWASKRSLEWVQTGPEGVLPSYWAGLTDRPMFYSRDLCHQLLGAHLLGLDTENLAMLRHFAGSANQRRGWYPLWAFLFDGTPAALDYHHDDDFVREVPVVFELVEKAVELYRWTRDERYLHSPELATYHRNAMTRFVELHDLLDTGVAGERGTGHIFDGTATYNEHENPPYLNVSADGIASQWAAHRALAGLAGAGTATPEGNTAAAASMIAATTAAATETAIDPDFAAWNAGRAAELEEQFAADWWLADHRHYTTGFTDEGPVAAFGVESSWFPALKGIMRADSRGAAHLDFVSAALQDTPPDNIEAFTYLPETFLRYGRDDEALHWIRYLARSRADYPEVPFTHVAHIATGLTGVEPGVRAGEVRSRSHIPADQWLEVDGIALGESVIGIRHEGHRASELWVTAGPAVDWTTTWQDGRVSRTAVPSGGRVRVTADDPVAPPAEQS
jgi:hypothetical protein